MVEQNFTRVKVLHRAWQGVLKLASTGNTFAREGDAATGTYLREGNRLELTWDRDKGRGLLHFFKAKAKLAPEIFTAASGLYLYTHESLLSIPPELDHFKGVTLNGNFLSATKLSLTLPGQNYEVTLRPQTSDIPTFDQVFGLREYDTVNLPPSADTIIDLGGNIGLATIFFGLKYPNARILAVEPEPDNFHLMQVNTQALGPRIQRLNAAAWTHDGTLSLDTQDPTGQPLGSWGVQVSELSEKSAQTTTCYKLPTLLTMAGFATVDILKVDIEGAELELFAHGAEAWLDRIKLIIVETHDRFRPGSEAAVRAALAQHFEELPRSGENLIFRRLTA